MRAPHPPATATLAGTSSSPALALWQRWNASQAAPSPGAISGASAITLHHWEAAPELAVPGGCVLWLPTPAQANANERALEQACRNQWMPAITTGSTSVQVLYGGPQQQWQALQHCLEALADAMAAIPEAMPLAAATPTLHGHAPGLRCRECLDPGSEQRLFSRLLARDAP